MSTKLRVTLREQAPHDGRTRWDIELSTEFRRYYEGTGARQQYTGYLRGHPSIDSAKNTIRPVVEFYTPSYREQPTIIYIVREYDAEKARRRKRVARLPHIHQPPNRPTEFAHETNDCVVMALRNSTGCSYAEAHAVCREKAQRKDRRGTFTHQLFGYGVRSFLGHVFKPQPLARIAGPGGGNRCSLGQFVKDNPVGLFLVCNSRHAFLVWDGHTVDAGSRLYASTVRIIDAWKVEKSS